MADVVQRRLEAMVPELHYCLKRRLLTRPEVTALVRQRRAFEYRLHRRTVAKLDYLRYIRSELLVEELLRVREGAGQGGKPGKARYGALRRVVRLLWSMIARWGFEGSTARTALQIAAAVPNRRLLARLYARLLQLHVHDVQLWSEAATYEFTANGNVRSARALFQRALRVNDQSLELWSAYHRLEAMHWQLVHDTRTAADAPAVMDAQSAAQAFEQLLVSLAKSSPMEVDDEPEEAQSFMAMAVLRRVAAEALSRCASPALVRSLLHVYADFLPHSLSAAIALLCSAVALCFDVTTRKRDDSKQAEWAAVLAEAPLLLRLGAQPTRSLDLCALAFEAAAARFGLSGALLLAQLHLYRTTAQEYASTLGGLPRVFFQKLFAQCAALEQCTLPSALIVEWLNFARSAPTEADASAVARAVCAAKPTNGDVWCTALQLACSAGVPDQELAQVLKAALSSSLPSHALASFAIEAYMLNLVPLPQSADALFSLLKPHFTLSPPAPLVGSLLSLLVLHFGLPAARRVADTLLQSASSASVVLSCVALEGPPHSHDATAIQHITSMLERALSLRSPPSPASQLWAALVQHLRFHHQPSAAQAAAWRARHSLHRVALASFERAVLQ